MKKYLFILPLAAMLFSSCEDLLKEESFTEVGKENYVKDAAEAENAIKARHAEAEIVSICGGQPVYDYIISVE